MGVNLLGHITDEVVRWPSCDKTLIGSESVICSNCVNNKGPPNWRAFGDECLTIHFGSREWRLLVAGWARAWQQDFINNVNDAIICFDVGDNNIGG